jgi:hypothetical protein
MTGRGFLGEKVETHCRGFFGSEIAIQSAGRYAACAASEAKGLTLAPLSFVDAGRAYFVDAAELAAALLVEFGTIA